ncbi:7566_t:CDS:2 [Cetraspora pellucida]|uniref:7566_t:CDS:1 n=1 Tax=Cetraspora pellucida TaxID=1433469 RepID=A0A9N9BD34_9GLOM|nr:7566_t:CDS:2 [Cetraspora pellucida]
MHVTSSVASTPLMGTPTSGYFIPKTFTPAAPTSDVSLRELPNTTGSFTPRFKPLPTIPTTHGSIPEHVPSSSMSTTFVPVAHSPTTYSPETPTSNYSMSKPNIHDLKYDDTSAGP